MIFKCGFSNFFSVLTQEQQAMLKKNHWSAVQLVLRIQIKCMEMASLRHGHGHGHGMADTVTASDSRAGGGAAT
jgi:hypothetical protein